MCRVGLEGRLDSFIVHQVDRFWVSGPAAGTFRHLAEPDGSAGLPNLLS